MRRFLISVPVLLSIIFLPYWVYLPLLLVALVVVPLYWEGMILGFLMDVLYGSAIHPGISFNFTFALLSLMIILIMIPLRERIRIHA